MVLHLSERQQRIIAAALTSVAVLVLCAVVLMAARLLLRFGLAFSGVFLPLATAGVLSLLLRPLYRRLRDRLRWPPVLCLAAIFVATLVPLVAAVWVFGGMVLDQVGALVSSAPVLLAHLRDWTGEHAPNLYRLLEEYQVLQRLQSLAAEQAGALVGLVAGGAQGLLSLFGWIGSLVTWAVLPVYVAFLLMAPPFRRENLPEFLPFLKEQTRNDLVFLINQFVDIVVTFFRGQLLIALAQGLLLAVGFSIVGLQYGFLLGLTLGILNIVPYLGNLVGLAVTLPLAYLQVGGGPGLIVAVLVVIAVVQTIEGYVLTPRIMGQRTGLHPMTIIVAMFFWGKALNGIFGMILAIPLTAFLVVFWRLAREKYIKELL